MLWSVRGFQGQYLALCLTCFLLQIRRQSWGKDKALLVLSPFLGDILHELDTIATYLFLLTNESLILVRAKSSVRPGRYSLPSQYDLLLHHHTKPPEKSIRGIYLFPVPCHLDVRHSETGLQGKSLQGKLLQQRGCSKCDSPQPYHGSPRAG